MAIRQNMSAIAGYLGEANYLGGVGLGAATLVSANTIGVSPLDLMPSPLTAPFWGAFMNPFTAASTINPFSGGGIGSRYMDANVQTGESVFSKRWGTFRQGRYRAGAGGQQIGNKFYAPGQFVKSSDITTSRNKFVTAQGAKYTGPLGYKTLMLGVQPGAGLASKLSIGNMLLSTAEGIGHGLTAAGWGNSQTITALRNARSLGIAGMMNIGEASSFGAADKLKWGKLFEYAGIDPADVVKGGSTKVTGQVAGSTVKKFFPKLGEGAVKKGFTIAATTGGRIFSTMAGAFSLYTYYDIISSVASFAGNTFVSGVGELAANVNQWIDEKRGLEFGYGRMPTAMMSSAAATERRRAVQATYGAKINPRNRLMGNEASYHHSR